MENIKVEKVADGKIKKFKFEWNDLRCLITIVNVVLIMIYGLSIAWFGLAIASLGVIKDLTELKTDKFRVANIVMHASNIALNIFFLCQL